MKPGILTSLLRQYQYLTAPRCYFNCNWTVNTQRQRQRQPAEYTQMQTTKQKLSNSEKTQGKQMRRVFWRMGSTGPFATSQRSNPRLRLRR